LEEVLRKIEHDEIRCIARDLPEPSPLAAEILNARPYAFLDNAPLEERRTQAVYTRRASEKNSSDGLGVLDAAAIDKVATDAWPKATGADELHDALMLIGVMAPEEIQRSAGKEDAQQFISALIIDNRATRLLVQAEHPKSCEVLKCGASAPLSNGSAASEKRRSTGVLQNAGAVKTFYVAAERLPLLRIIYPEATAEPELVLPNSMQRKTWDRANAIRELVRGRMEVCGPITVGELADTLVLQRPEINAALLALEAEGFVLRGKFHPQASEQEWCDRRLLARIHRLTIDRLRAEIQPVSIQDFYRFLFAWQRADHEPGLEGLEGLQSVLEQLDGYELPLAAWESAVLPARVADYDPEWLDRLCFSGRVGWGRFSPATKVVAGQNPNARMSAPLRTSPIALYQRENLQDWLMLAQANSGAELSVTSQTVFDTLQSGGALFFTELIRRSGLLASQVEDALSQLAALGLVTSDSFDGLRALLIPSNKRPTLGRKVGTRRRRANLASIEFAGRWSLLPRNGRVTTVADKSNGNAPNGADPNGLAIEKFAHLLLRRYGVVFRRLLERESFSVTWYELGRVYRRWEARGEIRGGYFVAGISGEQFALPEAIGMLRSIRKKSSNDELITLSAADPLNLQGILTPGPRIPAFTANRILFRNALPVAALEAGEIRKLSDTPVSDVEIETALKVGKLRPSLRPYYK
jgi:ATP-dependent Lhr-like helicase